MTIGSFLIGLVLLIIVLKILTFPLKVVIRFVINSIVGGIVLGIFAFFGINCRLSVEICRLSKNIDKSQLP